MLGSRRFQAPAIDPDLPITPMLDMSFQLMAFFVFTFRPAPAEGQFSLSTATAGPSVEVAFVGLEQPEVFIVRVEANAKGGIARLTLREKDGPDPKPLDLGIDLKKLQAELKSRYDALKGKPGKLKLEIEEALLHESVVQLLDLGIRAGFKDIAPVPVEK